MRTTWPMVLLWWNLELSKNSILVKPKLTSFLRPELSEHGLLQPPWRVRKNAFVKACLCTLVRKIFCDQRLTMTKKSHANVSLFRGHLVVEILFLRLALSCETQLFFPEKKLTSLHSRSRVPLWFEIGVFSVFSQKMALFSQDTWIGHSHWQCQRLFFAWRLVCHPVA